MKGKTNNDSLCSKKVEMGIVLNRIAGIKVFCVLTRKEIDLLKQFSSPL